MKRVANEPAFVLHRYDWSESSLILEVFTRHFGRIALVAKGAKRPSSNFRPVLLPLQPLAITWTGDAEVGTLKGAEWTGGQTMPTGDALLSGYYLNELLMRLLARDDPHETLFDAYLGAVRALRSPSNEELQVALRAFELMLLREIGLLPSLDCASLTMASLTQARAYCLAPEAGLRESGPDDPALPAEHWQALQLALDDSAPFAATQKACQAMTAPERTQLRKQLRTVLHYHCGTGMLRTRQMMMDMQDL
jgi:DNA repair protein RecO (recombination protein O)